MVKKSSEKKTSHYPITIVVEEDHFLNMSICNALNNEHLNCVGCFSGKECLDVLPDHPTGLLIIDHKLKDTTLFDIIAFLNKGKLANPFLIITDEHSEDLSVELMDLGAQNCIHMEKEFEKKLPAVVKNIYERIQISMMLFTAEEDKKESEERYRSLFEVMVDGCATFELIFGEDGNPVDYIYIDVNPAFEQIVGKKKNELVGKRVKEIFPQIESDSVNWLEIYSKVALEGGYNTYEGYSEYLGKYLSMNIYSTKNYYFASVIKDISERKASEITIRQSLKEKEILIQEIHHRVKNNLQIISSLINLELNKNELLKKENIFRDTLNRIRSISLIHENLYRSKNFNGINIRNYFNDLIKNLTTYFNIDTSNIKIITDIDEIFIDIDSLVPCGLILNEMLSNSFKYAFPDGEKGEIYFSFKTDKKNQIRVHFRDNGVGFPEGVNISDMNTLGLKLIKNLTEIQLNGDLDIKSEEGISYTMRFKQANNTRRDD